MNKPCNTQVVRHIKTRGIYVVVDGEAKVKIGKEGEWIQGVIYRNAYTGENFVRDLGEFCERFESYEIRNNDESNFPG